MFPNCSNHIKEMFWDAKFKYVKNLGERLNSQGFKNSLKRKMEKTDIEKLSTARH